MHHRRHLLFAGLAVILACLQIASCGGGSDDAEPMAQQSAIQLVASLPGVTPFIHFVSIDGAGMANVQSFRFTISPKPGSVSKAVSAAYTRNYLAQRGYATSATSRVTIPVFGLYAGFANQVSLELGFADDSSTTLPVVIATASYVDPQGIFDQPIIRTARTPGDALGFDFFYMKSAVSTPVVMDTDGEIRWIAAGTTNMRTSIFSANAFIVGNAASREVLQLELDGTMTTRNVMSSTYTNFHHNIDRGKLGLLVEPDAIVNGVTVVESIVSEITPVGTVLAEWNFETILSQYMASHGDDPLLFVRAGVDWFHVNAATFDPRDNTLIASSRENFVIKVDYQTGEVIWIFGDPTKYWHTFPSLRAKSVTLEAGGLYPIGQHAVSITPDGLLLLFNNGAASFNQPAGAPVGETRNYSAVSAYDIDWAARTAREVWRFDYDRTILSDICSSAYQSSDRSTLVSYAAAEGRTRARLVGLDPQRRVVFDFDFPAGGTCTASWNAEPIAFENLSMN
jgi:hypothetical protein